MVTIYFSPPNTQTDAKNDQFRDSLTGTQSTGTGDYGPLPTSKGPYYGDPRRAVVPCPLTNFTLSLSRSRAGQTHSNTNLIPPNSMEDHTKSDDRTIEEEVDKELEQLHLGRPFGGHFCTGRGGYVAGYFMVVSARAVFIPLEGLLVAGTNTANLTRAAPRNLMPIVVSYQSTLSVHVYSYTHTTSGSNTEDEERGSNTPDPTGELTVPTSLFVPAGDDVTTVVPMDAIADDLTGNTGPSNEATGGLQMERGLRPGTPRQNPRIPPSEAERLHNKREKNKRHKRGQRMRRQEIRRQDIINASSPLSGEAAEDTISTENSQGTLRGTSERTLRGGRGRTTNASGTPVAEPRGSLDQTPRGTFTSRGTSSGRIRGRGTRGRGTRGRGTRGRGSDESAAPHLRDPASTHTLTVASDVEGRDVAGDADRFLFRRGTRYGITGLHPAGPGRATIEVAGEAGIEDLTAALTGEGFTVGVTAPNMVRMSVLVPVRYATIPPHEYVAALQANNPDLPEGSLTLRGSAGERVERDGRTYPRNRVWVDVSHEGYAYLESSHFYLRTLTASVRLRPVSRGRHTSNNS